MAGKADKTLRMFVQYENGQAKVLSHKILDRMPVLSDPEPAVGTDATWVSVEGLGARFVRLLPHAGIGQEVFSSDGSVTRAFPQASRTITIDVPWSADGAEVVFRGPHRPGSYPENGLAAASSSWMELARFIPPSGAQAGLGLAPPAFPVKSLFTGGAKALKLVFLAEGFRTSELPLYHATVDAFIVKLRQTPPFRDMMNCLAAVRVESTSSESGIDDPLTGNSVSTWLDGTFGNGGLRRLITVNSARAAAAASLVAGKSSFVGIVVVNTLEYGGSGGQVAVVSRDERAADIALHELGHTAFGLADEYCDAGSDLGEPAEPNVTRKPDRTSTNWGPLDLQNLKWREFVTPGNALPTTRNMNCNQPFAGPEPLGVGLFEGGKYRNCQVYRPSRDCKMRTLTSDFCVVCQATIRQKLATFA